MFLHSLPGSTLRSLDLTGSTVQPSIYKAFGDLFQDNNTLESFSLRPVAPDALYSIAQGLHNNSTVQSLTLLGIGFGDLSLKPFSESIQTCTALRSLTLSHAAGNVLPDDMIRLVEALDNCKGLEQLALRKFDIGDQTIGPLAEVLSRSPRLVNVDLQRNHIGTCAADVLYTALCTRSRLDVLNLLDNELTQNDAEAIRLKERVRHLRIGWF